MPRKIAVVCPRVEEHTPGQPKAYLAWHDWAAKMAETHHQILCAGCQRYAIWVPGRVEPDGEAPVVTLRLKRGADGRQLLEA